MRRLPHSAEVAPFEDFDFDLEGIGALIYRTVNERLEQHLPNIGAGSNARCRAATPLAIELSRDWDAWFEDMSELIADPGRRQMP